MRLYPDRAYAPPMTLCLVVATLALAHLVGTLYWARTLTDRLDVEERRVNELTTRLAGVEVALSDLSRQMDGVLAVGVDPYVKMIQRVAQNKANL